jgi:hypothetical protein
MKALKRGYNLIPVDVLNNALAKGNISLEQKEEVIKENIVAYYNSKLIHLMKFEKWPEFFYVFETAKIFNHGISDATLVIAAHGYIMAYQNTQKAMEIISQLPETPAKRLTRSIFESYQELNSLGIAPASPDWIVLVNLTAAIANQKKTKDKWEKLISSPRTLWHQSLRPWKYPRHIIDIRDDFKFKQRKDK